MRPVSRTRVIVDGALTTNGTTVLTAAGASILALPHALVAQDAQSVILTAAIPLGCGIAMKLLGTWLEIIAHRKKNEMDIQKLREEIKMRNGGAGGGAGGGT